MQAAQIQEAEFKLEKQKYLEAFDYIKNGHLHEQNWVKNTINTYHQKIKEIEIYDCLICQESWPTVHKKCSQCNADKKIPKLVS